MTKCYLGVGLALGSLLLGGPASGLIGTIDAVPAATLLVPYFEVDLSNPCCPPPLSVGYTSTSCTPPSTQ